MRAALHLLPILGLLLVTACPTKSAKNFCYDCKQPGEGLPEGGEIRHERVNLLGMPPQTWLMVYQYTGPTLAQTAPFPAPAAQGKGTYGNCVDERTDATWPFSHITGATYLTLPQVKVSGPGMPAGGLDVIETNPPNMTGNSTFRNYDFTYGGGAPGVTDPTKPNFNATKTTAAMSMPDMDYTLDIGPAGNSGMGGAMTYHMPAAYTTPLGIGTSSTPITIPAHMPLEFTWAAPPNDFGPDGNTHVLDTHFNFTFFADPTSTTNPPQFICFPDVDGHQVIPQTVIDALPLNGLIVHADLNHWIDAADANGEMRRFDLVSIYCNISLYTIK